MKTQFQRWIIAAAILFFAGWANAQSTVYTAASNGNYTSKVDFSACVVGPCQDFTLAMGVSGSFTTSNPLAGNLAGASIAASVTSFNFSDGLTTYSSSDPAARVYMFQVSTNAAGAITGTTIVLNRWDTGTSPHSINDRHSLMLVTNSSQSGRNYKCTAIAVSPAGVADACDTEIADTGSSNASGATVAWSSVTTVSTARSIPSLSDFGLIIMSGILGLVAFGAMRRRAI